LDAQTPTGRNCKVISGESSVNMNRSNPIKHFGSILSVDKNGIDFNV